MFQPNRSGSRVLGLFPLVLLLIVCASACRSQPTASTTRTPPTPAPVPTLRPLNSLRVGWAYDAYPETGAAQMQAEMVHMRSSGANAIWIGHNNPGQVDAQQVEPGLSYAVYAALQNKSDPRHADAVAMADAIQRALDAARAAGLQVILPIGYQIQMGDAWNKLHPDSLRRDAAGNLLNIYNSGFTASPYDTTYRTDITRYYQWISSEWLGPYQDTIVMLSLADEPMGGDYSPAARQAFAAQYGVSMDALAPADQWKLGEFQSGVIVDYATWSATLWQQLNPDILTTISFHGGDTARRVWGLPDIERLFSETPTNFVVTFDAYLHDDLPQLPMAPDKAAQLKLFLTTLGNYSRLYHKPIALWGGANEWGLAQASTTPLGIPDAVTNMLLLEDLPHATGGTVWGVFAWNYNVKQQGLYNDTHPTTYDPKSVDIAVSQSFATLRERISETAASVPDIVILPPQHSLYTMLASSRESGAPPDWFETTPYARAFADHTAVFVTTAHALDSLRASPYWIIPAYADELDANMVSLIRARAQQGQIILGDPSLKKILQVPTQNWTSDLTHLPARAGVYIMNPAPE